MPVYFAGAPIREVFSLLPLIGKVSLGVGALSYAGQFNITVVADRAAYPDLDIFAAGVRNELHSLAAFTRGIRKTLGVGGPQASVAVCARKHDGLDLRLTTLPTLGRSDDGT